MSCQCIMCVTTPGTLWSWGARFSYTFPDVRVAGRVRIPLAISASHVEETSRRTRQSKQIAWCWEQRNIFGYHSQRVFQHLGHLPTVTPIRQALPSESHVDQEGQANKIPPKSHRDQMHQPAALVKEKPTRGKVSQAKHHKHALLG